MFRIMNRINAVVGLVLKWQFSSAHLKGRDIKYWDFGENFVTCANVSKTQRIWGSIDSNKRI